LKPLEPLEPLKPYEPYKPIAPISRPAAPAAKPSVTAKASAPTGTAATSKVGAQAAPVAARVPIAAVISSGASTPGVNAAIEDVGSPASVPARGLVEISVAQLVRGRYQPRREMDESSLRSLAASIRASGVMQPIAVREIDASDDRVAPVRAVVGAGAAVYEVVAGERRWRAAMLAGLTHIPAVLSTLSDREAAEWAIVENVQREDLNTMDRAWGLRNLVEGFGLQHGEVAERVGIERSSVTNLLRLTELETSVQSLLRDGALGLGHGKALLSANGGAEREKLAKMAASQKWSVRRLERAVGALGVGAAVPGQGTPKLGGTVGRDPLRADAAIRELEKQLGEHLGTRVRIMTGASRTKGRVVMDFYSLEHFDGLMGLMGVEIKS
jgi:ParB family chromosome partitioning protein